MTAIRRAFTAAAYERLVAIACGFRGDSCTSPALDWPPWPAPASPRARPAHSILAAPVRGREPAPRRDQMLLRIDDTDRSREVEGAVEEILADLEWIGIVWNDGPVRQSERVDRHREAATRGGGAGCGRLHPLRTGRRSLRPDGSPTYHLASVVDDNDFGITHVTPRCRPPREHRTSAALSPCALGFEPPEYLHHGLLLGLDGKKLSKRAGAPTLARGTQAQARPIPRRSGFSPTLHSSRSESLHRRCDCRAMLDTAATRRCAPSARASRCRESLSARGLHCERHRPRSSR